ncbi:Response regulator receiver domain-containing protein [Marivirga sericea]|uniref:Response regulator receiver domain-containing protein n=1 Tax=Marivirga sericea TaxID=1028 RepID=A0A1X7L547_9BACT|nr:response regulator [Marivirga sericea]SMG48855.1 Response regulator receiver domain-containing protein [Marivirga sericea]
MKKILIVDDEPSILMSLEFLMKKAGYSIFIARNGREAIEIVERELPDGLILDIMMPEVDGYEVCEFIKGNEKTKHIKVIFLTAKAKEEDVKKGLEAGADLYLKKPFATKELVKKVKDIIN